MPNDKPQKTAPPVEKPDEVDVSVESPATKPLRQIDPFDEERMDPVYHPFVRDEIRRVVRPTGQQDGVFETVGFAWHFGATQTIGAGVAIAPTALIIPIAGSGGPIVVSANPQIANGVNGQIVILKGTSDANTVTLQDGNGLMITGECELGLDDTITLCYDGDWVETARSFTDYGEISAHDNTTATTLALQDTFYQITIFDTDGLSKGATPDHSSDHITVGSTGRYLITFNVSVKSAQSNDYIFHVKTNNGTVDFANVATHRTTSNANAVGAAGASGIGSLFRGDTVEVWAERRDGGGVSKSMVVEVITLSIVKIG